MLSKFSESLKQKIINYSLLTYGIYLTNITVIIIKLGWMSSSNLLFFSISPRQSRHPSKPVLKTTVLLMFYTRNTRPLYIKT